jgi:hypothetical protein
LSQTGLAPQLSAFGLAAFSSESSLECSRRTWAFPMYSGGEGRDGGQEEELPQVLADSFSQ